MYGVYDTSAGLREPKEDNELKRKKTRRVEKESGKIYSEVLCVDVQARPLRARCNISTPLHNIPDIPRHESFPPFFFFIFLTLSK